MERNNPCNTGATDHATSVQVQEPKVAHAAAPGWDAETVGLINWFLATSPPQKPFQLYPGVFIARPAPYWAYLRGDIAAGPNVSRAVTGALQKDLRRLAKLSDQTNDADDNFADTRAPGLDP